MKYLRTVSTRRLLAMVGGLVAVIAAGTAIAVAAQGSGPVPPRESLAKAIRGAIAAPSAQGITARISLTNHLIDSSDIQGSDPLLTGGSGRLWLSRDGQLRLELQGDNGDAQVVVTRNSFWAYDPSSRTVYEGKLPTASTAKRRTSKTERLPSVAQIQRDLNRLVAHMNLSGAIPSDVAGRPAYTVRVGPKHDGGLLGSAELAWDSVHGVPLRAAVYARGDSTPVLELKATNISYGPVSTGVFKLSPPSGAKVVKVSTPASDHATTSHLTARGRLARAAARLRHADVTGVAAVSRRLPFKLDAPRSLVGLPRRSVTLLDWEGRPAALISYGQNLGGIAVIEHTATSSKLPAQTNGGDGHQGLSLPTVSINGVTGQELDTALGTVVEFSRAGVAYTVIGSVPPAAADAAARAL